VAAAAAAIPFIRPVDLSSRCSAFFSASFSFERRSADNFLDPCFVSPALGAGESEVVFGSGVVESSPTPFLFDLDGLVWAVDSFLEDALVVEVVVVIGVVVGVVAFSSCLVRIGAIACAGVTGVESPSFLVRIDDAGIVCAGAGMDAALVCAGVVVGSSS